MVATVAFGYVACQILTSFSFFESNGNFPLIGEKYTHKTPQVTPTRTWERGKEKGPTQRPDQMYNLT